MTLLYARKYEDKKLAPKASNIIQIIETQISKSSAAYANKLHFIGKDFNPS